MPDFDETIMSVAPTATRGMFEKTYEPIKKSNIYLNRYSAGTTINSSISINGNTYCAGTLSTG
jgi:hypothetical protein